jgi:hypothetical protein
VFSGLSGNEHYPFRRKGNVTKDFDAFYLVKPGTAERVMVSCGPNVLTVDADWDKGMPPAAYRDLIRSVGRALGFGDDDLSSGIRGVPE